MNTYVRRRDKTYYFVRRIPSDLEDVYTSDRISISLKTKDRHIANRIAKSMNQKLEDNWLGLRLQNSNIPVIKLLQSNKPIPIVKKREIKHRNGISAKNRAFVKRVKLFLGCALCGYKEHACALHFDHINPKEKFNMVSRMISYSTEILKEEMRKCRILCATCHAVHTKNQRKDIQNDSRSNHMSST